MRKMIKVVTGIIVAIAIISGCFLFYLSRGLDTVQATELKGIDLSKVENGVYLGEYEYGRWKNTIEIKVEDHKIKQLLLVNDVKIPKPEVSVELFNRVIHNQSTKVDTIAGATVNSKAYLKAIENGLRGK